MAKKFGVIRSFLTLVVIAAAAFAVIFFFFPDTSERYFHMSWNSTSDSGSDAETQAEAFVSELFDNISQAMADAGATKDQISETLSQIDTSTVSEAARNAVESGKDELGAFVDTLDEKIDFGPLDADTLKEKMRDTFDIRNVDFSKALDTLQNTLRRGLDDFGTFLKDLADKDT